VHLALSVVGLPDGDLVEHPIAEPRRGLTGLGHGVVPCTTQLKDFRLVHPAESVVGHHLGTCRAPGGEGIGPGRGGGDQVGVAAEDDCVAVEDSARDRRMRAGPDSQQKLVGEFQSFVRTAQHDQRVRLLVAGQRGEVRVSEAVGDPGRLRRVGQCGLPVSLAHLSQPDWDQQVAALGAVLTVLVDQAPGRREPPARERHLTLVHEAVPDPEASPRGHRQITGREVEAVRTHERRDVLLVPAEHVRRVAEALQVVGGERARGVHFGQPGMTLSPVALGAGTPGLVEQGVQIGHALIIDPL
jgi:hypothetical protein